MDREADVDHMPPSMFNTLSPGQSSPRLEASPLVFTIPPSASSPITSPVSPFLPRRSPRPLTFYHHNRYIIPRSVFYSRVTLWNAFVRDILYPPPPLFPCTIPDFPTLFVFYPIEIFFSFRYGAFFSDSRLCRWNCLRLLQEVALDDADMRIITTEKNEWLKRPEIMLVNP